MRDARSTDVALADAAFRNVSLPDFAIDDGDLVGMKIDGMLATDLLSAWRKAVG